MYKYIFKTVKILLYMYCTGDEPPKQKCIFVLGTSKYFACTKAQKIWDFGLVAQP